MINERDGLHDDANRKRTALWMQGLANNAVKKRAYECDLENEQFRILLTWCDVSTLSAASAMQRLKEICHVNEKKGSVAGSTKARTICTRMLMAGLYNIHCWLLAPVAYKIEWTVGKGWDCGCAVLRKPAKSEALRLDGKSHHPGCWATWLASDLGGQLTSKRWHPRWVANWPCLPKYELTALRCSAMSRKFIRTRPALSDYRFQVDSSSSSASVRKRCSHARWGLAYICAPIHLKLSILRCLIAYDVLLHQC